MEVFDRAMPGQNQLSRLREDVTVTREMMLTLHHGARSERGLRENIRVGIQYIEAWLGGRGAVPLYNLMEDAATAEISRAQIWQWLKFRASLDDGRNVTPELFAALVGDEMEKLGAAGGHFAEAAELFTRMSLAENFEEFLTLPAYEILRAEDTQAPRQVE
jgi:malate synthase